MNSKIPGKKKNSSPLTRKNFWQGAGIIRRYLAPHRREIYILIAFSIVSALAEAFVPFLAGRVFDAIIKIAADPTLSLFAIGAVIALWYILRFITDLADWQIASREEYLGTTLHGEYIAAAHAKLLLMPISFHRAKKHGEVGERISRAGGWLDTIVSSVLIHLTPRFLSVILALIITFFINILLAFILLGAVALYSVVLARSVTGLAYLQRRMHSAYSKAFGHAYDVLENIHEVKHATAEEFEARRLRHRFVAIAGRLWLDMNRLFRRIDFVQRIIVSLTQLAIFSASVILVKNRVITPGELVAFNGYAAMLFGPFVVLGHNWNTIQNGLVALVQSENVLSLPTEAYTPKDAAVISPLKGAVAFKNVSFSHGGGKAVLKDVSFSIEPGKTVALVGESGVGKTTLIELILGFHFPKSGRVLIDDHDIRTLDLKAHRGQIAVVPQEPSLFNDTIEMNIRYGAFDASDGAVRKAAGEAHAAEFIEAFPEKYRQLVGWRGVKLSTGQKQRIAIARAILRDPRILILDEPTSALDAKSESAIKESLAKLMKGRTTFIIAHRLSTVREADTIIVLDKGAIAEIGTHDELLRKGGIYTELYNLQFKSRDINE